MTENKELSIDELRSKVLEAIINDVVRFDYEIDGNTYEFEIKSPSVDLVNDILNFNLKSDALVHYIVNNLLCRGAKFYRPVDMKYVREAPVGSLVSTLLIEIQEHMVKQQELKKK